MKIGRTLELTCGHSTGTEELEVTQGSSFPDSKYVNFNCVEMLDSLPLYCNKCRKQFKAVRINIFLISSAVNLNLVT